MSELISKRAVALQIMLKLIETQQAFLYKYFESGANTKDVVPGKVGEFYNKLLSSIETNQK